MTDKMKCLVLSTLVAAICIFRIASQVAIFVRAPDLLEHLPFLSFVGTWGCVLLQAVAVYLVLTRKPFQTFLALVAAAGLHAVFFLVQAAVSASTGFSGHFLIGFTITALVHILLAALAYIGWRIARREKKTNDMLVRA